MIRLDPTEPRLPQGGDGRKSERAGHEATPGLAPGEAGGEDAPCLSLSSTRGVLGTWVRTEPPPAWPQASPFQGETFPGPGGWWGGSAAAGLGPGGALLPHDTPALKHIGPGVSGSQGAPSKGSLSPACVPTQGRSKTRGRHSGEQGTLCFRDEVQVCWPGGPGGTGYMPGQTPAPTWKREKWGRGAGSPGRGCGAGGREQGAGETLGIHASSPGGPASLSPSRDAGVTPRRGISRGDHLPSSSQAFAEDPARWD